jgi:hypothetical protein
MSNERTQKWVLKTYDIPGRKVVHTEGIGKATLEDVKKTTDYVITKGKSFGGKWAYIAGIEKMDPVFDAETQQEFARMHQLCEQNGCVAMGFVAGGMAAIKVQAKRHQKDSQADKLQTEHFRTSEEALDWIATFGI